MMKPTTISLEREVQKRSFGHRVWETLSHNRSACAGLLILCLIALLAIFGPLFSSHNYFDTHLCAKNHPPCKEFWFGSDDLGRDLFVRVCIGARISLIIAIAAASIDLLIGIVWGSIAALSGGRIDMLMMRCTDILYSLPHLLIVILLMMVMQPSLLPIILALTVIGWIGMARMVRSELLKLRSQEFVLAAIALGGSRRRILFKHLIPNAIGPIIITITLTIPAAIFAETSLSFLGLGVQAPMASWGTMAYDGLAAMRYYPWRLFFPAFFVTLTILSFNLVADGLHDAMNTEK